MSRQGRPPKPDSYDTVVLLRWHKAVVDRIRRRATSTGQRYTQLVRQWVMRALEIEEARGSLAGQNLAEMIRTIVRMRDEGLSESTITRQVREAGRGVR